MPGCCAVGCSNSSAKGYKVHKFPSSKNDQERRKIWITRIKRKGFIPTKHTVLCEEHFEESQFELHRKDGWKKLKQTAIPTIFNFDLNQTPKKNKIKQIKPDNSLQSYPEVSAKENNHQSEGDLKRRIMLLEKENESLRDTLKEKDQVLSQKIVLLEKENESLRKALNDYDKMLSSFLTEDQITALQVPKQSIAYWTHNSITKALNMRINLGRKGYNYLRNTGYPLPSLGTLNKRIRNMKLDILLENDDNDMDDDSDVNDISENCIDEDNIDMNS